MCKMDEIGAQTINQQAVELVVPSGVAQSADHLSNDEQRLRHRGERQILPRRRRRCGRSLCTASRKAMPKGRARSRKQALHSVGHGLRGVAEDAN